MNGQPASASVKEAIVELVSYWLSLRQGAILPSRSLLDPVRMRKQLPSVGLMDVLPGIEGPGRFRQRLAGTNLFNLHGREITGLTLPQIYPEAEALSWTQQLDAIVESKTPAFGEHDLSWRGMTGVKVAWVRLPLSSNGTDVDMILGYDAVFGAIRLSPSGVCAA